MHHRKVPARTIGPWIAARRSPLVLAIGGLLAAGPSLAVEVPSYTWTWASPGYVDWAKTCARAKGTGTNGCGLPPYSASSGWYNAAPPDDSPIMTRGAYQDDPDPTTNSYYDWVNSATNGPGYAFRIDSVGITATGAVGTNGTNVNPADNTNARGIGTGSGISGTWELGADGAASAKIENARVQIKSGTLSALTSWGLAGASSQLVDGQTGPWVTGLTPQTPVQTPIDKTFTSTLAADSRAITYGSGTDGAIRIQFYQQGASTESPSAILSDLTVTFNIQTANLKSGNETVVARVGGATQTATVDVSNIPTSGLGFRATGVSAPALDGSTNPSGFFSRKDPLVTPSTIAAGATLSTDYLFNVSQLHAYGNYQASVQVNPGDSPGDASLAVTLTGIAVGPTAQVSGYAGAGVTSEGQLYLGGTVQAIDGLNTELKELKNGKFYRDLTFDNIFGTDYASLTDLTLGLNYADANNGVTLFRLDGSDEIAINVGDQIGPIAANGGERMFRVYLDPTKALTTCPLIPGSADYCGDLLLTTDVQRALGTTTLANGSTIFKFDLYANDSGPPVPLPGTLALVGLGLAGLRMRRRR